MTVFASVTRVTLTQYGMPLRRLADSVVGLTQGHVDLLILIVARGYGKRHSSRVTHFAASAVPEAVV